MNYLLLFSYFVLMASNCFAVKYIQPTKYEDQEEILVQGASILCSQKIHKVSMYQTMEKISSSTCNFFFAILNQSDKTFNFRVSDLVVTDQKGNLIKIVSRQEQLKKKNRDKNWALTIEAFNAGAESMNAAQAGNIHYGTQTYNNYSSNFHGYNSSRNWLNTNVNGSSSSYSTGTVQIEALKQQAQRQVALDSQIRTGNIEAIYNDYVYAYNNYYFDANTIFPNMTYAANFQIEIPRYIEKDLEYLLFTYYLDGEEHTFCYYCWK